MATQTSTGDRPPVADLLSARRAMGGGLLWAIGMLLIDFTSLALVGLRIAGVLLLAILANRLLHLLTRRIELAGRDGGNLRISLRGNCFQKAQVSRVTPEPMSSVPLDPGAIYIFPVTAASGRMDVTISLEPGAIGPATCRVARADAEAIDLHQFILP